MQLQDGTIGKIEVEFEDAPYPGIACNIDSEGFKCLSTATQEVIGEVGTFLVLFPLSNIPFFLHLPISASLTPLVEVFPLCVSSNKLDLMCKSVVMERALFTMEVFSF